MAKVTVNKKWVDVPVKTIKRFEKITAIKLELKLKEALFLKILVGLTTTSTCNDLYCQLTKVIPFTCDSAFVTSSVAVTNDADAALDQCLKDHDS